MTGVAPLGQGLGDRHGIREDVDVSGPCEIGAVLGEIFGEPQDGASSIEVDGVPVRDHGEAGAGDCGLSNRVPADSHRQVGLELGAHCDGAAVGAGELALSGKVGDVATHCRFSNVE